MEYVQMTFDDWIKIKDSLKKDLIGVQESFVRIGYKLRQIEEQKLYEKDGFTTITEFAKAEYGLSSSTVSRFMAINRKFSIDGDSEYLRPEYTELGSSKLSEMLSLPETDMSMITKDVTKENIRELKRFNKSEPEEGTDEIHELIEAFFEANGETLNQIYGSGAYTTWNVREMTEIVNPGGNRSFKKGIFFLMMYENNIKVKKFGGIPQDMTWEDFFDKMQEIFADDAAGINTYARHFVGGTDESETERTDEEVTDATKEGENTKEDDAESKGDAIKEVPGNNETGGTDHNASVGSVGQECRRSSGDHKESVHDIKTQEKEEKKEIAPAQENRINTVTAEDFEQEKEQQKELHKEETMEKPEGHEWMTRKEFMETLSEIMMAVYLYNSLTEKELSSLDEMEKYLKEKVDENGITQEELCK